MKFWLILLLVLAYWMNLQKNITPNGAKAIQYTNFKQKYGPGVAKLPDCQIYSQGFSPTSISFVVHDHSTLLTPIITCLPMSRATRIFLILLVLAIYYFGLLNFCSRQICEACGTQDHASTTSAPGDSLGLRFPINFQAQNMKPDQGPGFDSLMTAVMAGNAEDKLLEIIGWYYGDEPKPAGHENMGLARAAAIRDAYFKDIPDERIQLRARKLEGDAPAGYFNASEFVWLSRQDVIPETVEEVADGILIRFPFNSTQKDYDPEVEKYLQALAKRIVASGEKVSLTGHTDNVGEEPANLKLGEERAKQIRSILTRLGVKAAQIQIASRGETEPVAPNTTDAGRHNNRRVEVKVLK
jgi:OmpA-OmpF porin, OOP family